MKVWKLVMQDSIEERMVEVCQDKNSNADEFLKKNGDGIDSSVLRKLFSK